MHRAASTVDVLMITYNAPAYVHLSLPRLLDSCDDHVRVWLWHNGDDEETLETTRTYANDGRVFRFHHSRENVGVTEPTNWLWREGDGAFVSKVDDDCLLPLDWIDRLRAAHEADERFGALGASRLRPDDIDHSLITKKLERFGDVEIFRNNWVQGSGYLLRRSLVEHRGALQPGEGFTNYCLALALEGAIHGFPWPLVFEDHMDDPRSEHTLMKSDADLAWRMPLSINRSNVRTVEDWERQMRRSALEVQRAPLDTRQWVGWRRRVRNLRRKIDDRRRAR